MTHPDPIRFGLTGLGGYGAQTCDRLIGEMSQANPRAILRTVYERNPDKYPLQVAKLAAHDIKVVSDYAQFLETPDLDIVWLPLPIDLHRKYTEMTLDAGKAVLCEKPAAGCVEDVDAMIAARDRTKLPVAIGYQDVYQPAVQELKRRIIRGEFGVVLSASVLGCWPRSRVYYTRNGWAGKIQRDGRWVLDSPASNAMSHYLHLALFLLGPTERESAVPSEVEAELYRANDIENYDTCSMRLTFDNGVHIIAGLTHACQTTMPAEVVIRTQFARIRFVHEKQIEIHRSNVSEIIPLVQGRIKGILDTMRKWLRDGSDSVPGGTLEMARAHTVAINAASEASTIKTIPSEQIETGAYSAENPLRIVPGIEAAMQASIREDRMLHELGVVQWSAPAGDITLRDYNRFAGPKC